MRSLLCSTIVFFLISCGKNSSQVQTYDTFKIPAGNYETTCLLNSQNNTSLILQMTVQENDTRVLSTKNYTTTNCTGAENIQSIGQESLTYPKAKLAESTSYFAAPAGNQTRYTAFHLSNDDIYMQEPVTSLGSSAAETFAAFTNSPLTEADIVYIRK